MFQRTALVLLFFLAPLGVGCRATEIARDDPRHLALRATCVAFADQHGVVGMGVAVIDDRRVVFDEALGFADREVPRPARTSTLYRLGSISKPVCAAIAMQLVEAHVLALDGPIGGHVAGLPDAIQPLTLRQLLSHTSGVRHYATAREDNSTTHRSTDESLQLFVKDPLLLEAGAKYSYSTHAYTLIVAAIEAATKRDYVAVLRERMHDFAPTLDCEVASDVKLERSSLYDRLDSGEAARVGSEAGDRGGRSRHGSVRAGRRILQCSARARRRHIKEGRVDALAGVLSAGPWP